MSLLEHYKLDVVQTLRALQLSDAVMEDPEAAAREIVALRIEVARLQQALAARTDGD